MESSPIDRSFPDSRLTHSSGTSISDSNAYKDSSNLVWWWWWFLPIRDAANDEKILQTSKLHLLCSCLHINRQRHSRFPTLVPSLVLMLVSDDDNEDGGGDCVIVVVTNDFKAKVIDWLGCLALMISASSLFSCSAMSLVQLITSFPATERN